VAGAVDDHFEVTIDIVVQGDVAPEPTAVADLVADTFGEIAGAGGGRPIAPVSTPIPTAPPEVFTARVDACGLSDTHFMVQMGDENSFAAEYVVYNRSQGVVAKLLRAFAADSIANSGRYQLSWAFADNGIVNPDEVALVAAQNPGETISYPVRCEAIGPNGTSFNTD